MCIICAMREPRMKRSSDSTRLAVTVSLVTQIVFSSLAVGFLWGHDARTGLSQNLGATAAAFSTLEAGVRLALHISDRFYSWVKIASIIVATLSYAALAGLVCNTEDGRHPEAVDRIELASCVYVIGWGAHIASLALARGKYNPLEEKIELQI